MIVERHVVSINKYFPLFINWSIILFKQKNNVTVCNKKRVNNWIILIIFFSKNIGQNANELADSNHLKSWFSFFVSKFCLPSKQFEKIINIGYYLQPATFSAFSESIILWLEKTNRILILDYFVNIRNSIVSVFVY